MEKQLLKLLLKHEFYLANKSKLISQMFPDELGNIYELLEQAHKTYAHDLTIPELGSVYEHVNPAATRAAKYNFKLLLERLAETPDVSQDIAKDLIGGLWRRETARQIAEVAIDVINGQPRSLNEIRGILEKIDKSPIPVDNYKVAPSDIEELLEIADEKHRFLFNTPELVRLVGGIGRSEFGIIFARPETGKTASWVSLAAAPGGWLEQGYSVHGIINEEPAWRTQLRCISSYSGLTKEGIKADLVSTKEKWSHVADKLRLVDSVDFSVEAIDNYVRENRPDILVVDQLDKVHIDGSFARTDERLKAIYVCARETAKRHDIAYFGISQASAEAEGKRSLSMDMLENSRTGKAAEADLIIGIGKSPMDANGQDDTTRTWNIIKNKITGWHGHIHMVLRQDISRYEQ